MNGSTFITDLNQKTGLRWKPIKKVDLEMVEYLLKEVGGMQQVDSVRGWEVIQKACELFAYKFPKEYEAFKDSISDIRKTRRAGGYSQTKEIKYVAAVPGRLVKLISLLFPQQEWDKDFVYKLIENFPLLSVGREANG